MPTLFQDSDRPGFCGSQHGNARVTIYRRGNAELRIPATPLPLDGRTERDPNPTITSLTVQNTMAQGGSFQVSMKLPEGQHLLDLCTDDDWVDIELGINGTYWHVMRGLIDEVRESASASGSGVTSRSAMISGQSFQKVWASTPMWHSATRAENLGGAELQGIAGIGLDVPGTIASFLFDYTNSIAQRERSSVAMPLAMPGVRSDFADSWAQDETGFNDDDIPRVNLLRNSFFPNQNVWEVAQSWADPYFCEVYTDILPAAPTEPSDRPPDRLGRVQRVNAESAYSRLGSDPASLRRGLPTDQSAMTLVVRNKPFISVAYAGSYLLGRESPWFSLPMTTVPYQHVVQTDIGRSGYERFNAFMCAAQFADAGRSVSVRDVSLPLWNVDDMRQHGIRIMDCVTNYEPRQAGQGATVDSTTFARRLRTKLRDWYAAASYYLNGSVTFGRGVPDLRVGTRLRLTGSNPSDQLTAYVEQVSHTFSPGGGVRTQAGITRGYRGTDAEHLALLATLVTQYSAPEG